MPRNLLSRFWAKVSKSSGCWLWTAAIRNPADGYGAFWIGGRHRTAHHVPWMMENGPIPPGLILAHKCDNPRCVRPSHLFLTNQAGNMADKVAKGRQARGQRGGNATLSDKQAAEIRASKARSVDLAAQYGVHRTTIWAIRSGRIRKHEMRPCP